MCPPLWKQPDFPRASALALEGPLTPYVARAAKTSAVSAIVLANVSKSSPSSAPSAAFSSSNTLYLRAARAEREVRKGHTGLDQPPRTQGRHLPPRPLPLAPAFVEQLQNLDHGAPRLLQPLGGHLDKHEGDVAATKQVLRMGEISGRRVSATAPRPGQTEGTVGRCHRTLAPSSTWCSLPSAEMRRIYTSSSAPPSDPLPSCAAPPPPNRSSSSSVTNRTGGYASGWSEPSSTRPTPAVLDTASCEGGEGGQRLCHNSQKRRLCKGRAPGGR